MLAAEEYNDKEDATEKNLVAACSALQMTFGSATIRDELKSEQKTPRSTQSVAKAARGWCNIFFAVCGDGEDPASDSKTRR